MLEPMVVRMRVSTDAVTFGMSVDTSISMGEMVEHYTGSTHVVPSDSTQRLNTEYTIVDSDIIIDPIPSNYGLITWNGTVLTVS